MSRAIFFMVSLFILITLDQLSKLWFQTHFNLHESLSVMPGFAFTLVHNQGAAFGMLGAGLLWQKLMLTGIGVVATVILLFLILKHAITRLEAIAYLCVCAGAVGNVIDRIRQGYVVDFVDWYYQSWHWPAFNFADIYICLGAFLLLWAWFGTQFCRRS